MEIQQVMLTPGASHGRPGYKLVPKGILIHYVGNPSSTAMANRNYFENSGSGASAHYIVGLLGEILMLVPENECAQHAGKSYAAQYDEIAKTNNGTYLGIETCHPSATGEFTETTIISLVELCVDICKRYGFDPVTDIKRHYDVTGKQCPLYYVKNTQSWEDFKQRVKKQISNSEKEKQEVRFTTINDIPDYGKPTIQKLLDKGLLAGKENGIIDISEDMLRLLVINDRAGLY